MTESGDGDERPRSLLADCIEEPERAKRRLPAVVGLLENDDEVTRLAAAWTCCLVATTHPDTVEYVVRRLSDRLDGEASLELTHALDYLADRHPDAVEAVLADLEAAAADAGERRRIPFPESGRFTRNHYYTHEPTRQGVGRVRVPGTEGRADPRSTYTSEQPDERDSADAGEEVTEEREAPRRDADADVESHELPTDERESHETGTTGREDEAGTLAGPTPDVSAIADRSRFDHLHVLATRDRSRYSANYRALVGSDGEEQAVSLRVLDLPAAAVRETFEVDVEAVLARWSAVDDHPHVVTVLDWGVEPRPWLATTYAGESLVGGDPQPYERARTDAIALADAVAHVHQNDVVHGGIDPGNVAYPEDVLDDNDQEPPLLNNVGLLRCFRQYENPARVLDPRYAAPEYFDRRFGVVDAATDIYQLGTVVYHLFVGRPPFAGSFDEVRDAVTSPTIPVPSDVRDDVPPGIDDVVSKAMATQKLTRYEAVEHLRADLRSIQGDATQ